MIEIDREPSVSVGLIAGVEALRFELKGRYLVAGNMEFNAGNYRVSASSDWVQVTDTRGRPVYQSSELYLRPVDNNQSFIVCDVVIGIDFHWQRKEDQEFRGALRIKPDRNGKLIVINEIAVESYLASVIASEMSAGSHTELLKAHAIISRSWLLAQLKLQSRTGRGRRDKSGDGQNRYIRWYDRESHLDFDVCADDHCQRYQGITKAATQAVFESVQSTFGRVLTYDGRLCDARFSKSCGGMTESYDAAWEDLKIPYLTGSYDGEIFPPGFALPLSSETNASAWISNSPPAFCNTADGNVLGKILPDFDQETADFYRWRVEIRQDELQELLHRKIGIDFGPVFKLEPVNRGASGRLIKLKITGERETVIIGKELAIRRALSPSHLYSSAFIVDADGDETPPPARFRLIGAGWGHGVGLCQIGAAVMAERGYDYQRILAHYYGGSQLHTLYTGAA